jgi:hypothetical protein
MLIVYVPIALRIMKLIDFDQIKDPVLEAFYREAAFFHKVQQHEVYSKSDHDLEDLCETTHVTKQTGQDMYSNPTTPN